MIFSIDAEGWLRYREREEDALHPLDSLSLDGFGRRFTEIVSVDQSRREVVLRAGQDRYRLRWAGPFWLESELQAFRNSCTLELLEAVE
jgi:hypothetical protein